MCRKLVRRATRKGTGCLSNFSAQELNAIAARASSFDERVSVGYASVGFVSTEDKLPQRMEQLSAAAAAGPAELVFSLHLEREGASLDEVTPLLGDVALAPTVKAPQWIETFALAVTAMFDVSFPTCDAPEYARPIPFEEIFLPVASAAWLQCAKSPDAHDNLLSPRAKVALQRVLIHRLSDVCGPSLHDCFAIERMFPNSGPSAPSRFESSQNGDRVKYLCFLNQMRSGELRSFFIQRPVLARIVGTTIDQWIETTSRLIERLQIDKRLIAETFHGGADLGLVVDLEGDLSDPHNGGNSVYRLTFSCGVSVGYKPKDLRIDEAWRALLSWLEAHAAPPSARAARAIAKEGYGWVEWLKQSPCENETEAETFFCRAGSLLCLLHALQGIDFHRENILAVGQAPAAVDLETLLHPTALSYLEHDALRATADSSVQRTGYLPAWQILPTGEVVPFGGLNPESELLGGYLGFRQINRDDMQYDRHEIIRFGPTAHLPSLNGRSLSVADYKTQFLQGFSTMYLYLVKQRKKILARDGPLHVFDEVLIRVVLRPTFVYQKFLHMSLRRKCVVDGVSWSMNFLLLPDLDNSSNCNHTRRKLSRLERQSLERMDIPYFFAKANGRDLLLADGTRIEGFFNQKSLDSVRDRIRSLSRSNLKRQLAVVVDAINAIAGSPAGLC